MIAVYRCLYGEDFVTESVLSILPHVERVVFVLAPRPWGASTGVDHRGKRYTWPRRFDGLRDRVVDLNHLTMRLAGGGVSSVDGQRITTSMTFKPTIEIIDDFYPSPFGQYKHIVDNVLKPRGYLPNDILFIEPDHVFADFGAAIDKWRGFRLGFVAATTRQVELWAPPGHKPLWCAPERNRAAAVFHRDVASGADLADPMARPPLDVTVHNLGFCFSAATMLWKHLTAMAFASEIGDCPPDHDWYEKKWLGWDPVTNNYDLEPAKGLGFKIPQVVPYDAALLPASIKRRYGL